MASRLGKGRSDLPCFVELPGFSENWRDLGLDDDDLSVLQKLILLNPRGHPVVAGTGGLRKVRFAPPKIAKGKSGQLRVVYVYFSRFGLILLVSAYKKSKKDDLSPAEKKGIKKLIDRIEVELEQTEGSA
jgi:hypothetical protein